tara:strand:+ start:35730 stop:36044 length:315 start_codon:yes stop_codon:yes gene_type:complete
MSQTPTNQNGTINFSLKAQRAYAQETRDWQLMDKIISVEEASAAKSFAKSGPARLDAQIQATRVKLDLLESQRAELDDADLNTAIQAHIMAKDSLRQYVIETQG